ncbi:putative peptidoglycan binding protein [Lutibacter sp. Hel_I_33_5]|uniref:peptidoglycan-binding domain-containing protein n=1 Tax=Lutibacter sp. Hel_I_33_5 TaxID=1566289 RepID=UPI0011A27827|nr:peptidoglycan-binding domain-containing protein [Lutibacter sp. Hel_I_33_5]TVZ55912.1 putative peptidoglycan binding protein [Lutibacter sp. Hel_I_33_5]
MKQIIIFLLLIIAFFIGFGKYQQYKRYHTEEVNYKTAKKIDADYHNKEVLLKYYEAIEDINSFVKMEWTANDIDVRTPEDDDAETQRAIKNYSKKIAKIKFYEDILENSLQLKEKGLSNKDIKFLEETGLDYKSHQKNLKFDKIKGLYNSEIKIYNGRKSPLTFEVQKQLTKLGYTLDIDGAYRQETINAVKDFETKNNLLSDGLLDVITLEKLFE